MLGTGDDSVGRHLAICHACSAAVEELRSAISGFRDSIHATAQRDQRFWRNQQLAIRQQASGWFPLHWAWVAAMVLVLITAIFLTRAPNTPQNTATEDADNALLQEVQGDLAREVPKALAPAVLIAEERNEILTNIDSRQTKSGLKKRRETK
jgi:hypothetical protein